MTCDVWGSKPSKHTVWGLRAQGSGNERPKEGAVKVVSRRIILPGTPKETQTSGLFMHVVGGAPPVCKSLECARCYTGPRSFHDGEQSCCMVKGVARAGPSREGMQQGIDEKLPRRAVVPHGDELLFISHTL